MNSQYKSIQLKADACAQKSKYKKSLKQYCFTLIIMFYAAFAYSQATIRAEINLQESEACYVFPVKTYGVLVQSEIIPKSGKKERIRLEYFDVNLLKLKTDSFEIPKCTDYYDSFQNEALNYILVWDKNNTFSLFSADFKSYKSTVFIGEFPSQISVFQFVVLGKFLYIRCAIGKQNTLLQINMETKKQTKLPIQIKDFRRSDLYSRDLLVSGDEVLVFVQAEITAKSSELYMFRYSVDGKLLKTINLTKNIDEKILETRVSVIEGRVMLSGTYSKTNSEYSQGAFFAELINDEVVNPRFYNFLQLKKFSAYLSEKSQGAIERKSDKLEDKNTELLINTFAIVHTAQRIQDGYLLACEFYIPDPSYQNYISFTHACLLKLNLKGDLIWDESIKLNMIGNGFTRRPVVAVNENSSGDISMSFARQKNIVSKTMDKNGKVLKEKILDIKSLSSSDSKTKGNSYTVDAWYENFFIASGFQKVTSKSTKEKKEIFFLNKLSSDN